MKQIAAREAVSLLKTMTRVLCAVGTLALVFTTVNVTRFATSRDVPLPIAVLLDPMIGTALAGVLYVDARLASWGITPPTWSTTLRWTAGCTAALMNTWESLWPDGQIGWPRHADPAAVLLHLTPALLLIALTETIAAYRRTITELLDQIDATDPTRPSARGTTAAQPRSVREPIEPISTDPDEPNCPLAEGKPDTRRSGDPNATAWGQGSPEPLTSDKPLRSPWTALGPRPARNSTADGDLWHHAMALDDDARATTGKPVSIWRLRTDLHIGPPRARQIHDRLMSRHQATPPPKPQPEPLPSPARRTSETDQDSHRHSHSPTSPADQRR